MAASVDEPGLEIKPAGAAAIPGRAVHGLIPADSRLFPGGGTG
jgi:hypothetical protein